MYRFTSQRSPWSMIPQGVRWLLSANLAVFVLQSLLPEYFWYHYLALTPHAMITHGLVWQLVTYMFLHGGFWHIALNMLILWMFGSELERRWGTRPFLYFYFISGIGAGLFGFLTWNSTIIGASGAIYGLMLAYAMIYPDREIYLYMVLPIKAKHFIIFLTIISLLMGMNGSFGSGDGVAHFVHLGGMVVGYIYLRYPTWERKFKVLLQRQRMERFMRDQQKDEQERQDVQSRVDQLLDKISRVGYDNLSREEKDFLREASDYFTRNRKS